MGRHNREMTDQTGAWQEPFFWLSSRVEPGKGAVRTQVCSALVPPNFPPLLTVS